EMALICSMEVIAAPAKKSNPKGSTGRHRPWPGSSPPASAVNHALTARSSRFMPYCKLFAVAISALLPAACAGPMDSHLVTGQGEAAYFARLNPLFAQMTPEQQEAFNWSVSDL